MRTDSSPKSIAKEILQKLEKIPIKPHNLEAEPTPTKQTEEMEQQQEEILALEDINGALMDDIRVIMQDELRQALFGLLSPPTIAIAPAVEPAPAAAIPPATLINNVGGQPDARNVPAAEVKLGDVENYMVEKAKRESLEVIQELESKQMQVLTQKMSKME